MFRTFPRERLSRLKRSVTSRVSVRLSPPLRRSRRLVSKAQRRALMIRDQMCRYPGCHSTRHLKAHHVVPWILGGRTDLVNLILLCQWHHTTVHEGGVTITRNGDGWVSGNRMASRVTGGLTMTTWPGTLTSRCAAANKD